jgi:nitrogen-specific signal transduction histidine kinase
MKSVTEQSLNRIVWCIFSLAFVLPVLSLLKIAIVLVSNERITRTSMFEIGSITVFGIFSLIAGFYFLNKWVKQVHSIVHDATQDELLPNSVTQNEASTPSSDSQTRSARHTTTVLNFNPATNGNELDIIQSRLSTLQQGLNSSLTELQEKTSFLRYVEILLNQCEEMVAITNEANVVLYSNHQMKKEIGLVPDRELHNALSESRLLDEDAYRLAQTFTNQSEDINNLFVRRVDGARLRVTVKKVTDTCSGSTFRTLLLTDISHETHLADRFYSLERTHIAGSLISGIAHELNNPLSAILGFAELSQSMPQDADEATLGGHIIKREAQKAAYLVENFLNFVRPRSMDSSTTDVHDSIERTLTLVSYRLRTGNICIQRDYDSLLPPIQIDNYKFQYAFMNVLLNAIEALENSETVEPLIRIRTEADVDEESLILRVEDNGEGVSLAMESDLKLFDSFTTSKDNKTGLGLTITQSLLEETGGSISHHNSELGGASFALRLPTALLEDAQGHLTQHSFKRKPHKRILVATCNEQITESIKSHPLTKGSEIVHCSTVTDSIDQMTRNEFDGIITETSLKDGQAEDIWNFVRRYQPEIAGSLIFVCASHKLAKRLTNRLGIIPHILIEPINETELGSILSKTLPSSPSATSMSHA